MTHSDIVILGGGMVAGYAAKELVERGLANGTLAIVSADSAPPYERPPLSKGFLAGKENEDSIKISSQDFYKEHGIELRLKSEVAHVNTAQKSLQFSRGEEFRFEKLLVATGAQPRILDIPGAGLQNLFYLRSLNDSQNIRSAVANAKRAVVIGGGFIGMEVAAVIAQKGLEVTMILNEDRVFKRLFSPEMSNFFESYYKARGVKLIKSMSVAEFRGEKAVDSAVMKNGQNIACDLVVAGIGVLPAVDVVKSSGLHINDGILVNEYLETNHSNIWAAGDVANYKDVIFNKRRRVEHWDNAVSQGLYCARALMGERTPFRHVPYFFSDVFDLSYEYWGNSADADQVLERGDLSSSSFSVWWLRQERVIAAFIMNRPDGERAVAPKWIESAQPVEASKLRNSSQPIEQAASSTKA